MREKLYKLMLTASVLEITADKIRMRQFLDRWGVCFIPVKQDEAARRLLALLGRKITGVTGSKRGISTTSSSLP